jgi:phosphoglucosamine mutase
VLGAEQSGHVICLDGHVTGDGLAAALLLCGALDGRRLSEAAAVLELLPQAKENVAMDGRALTREVLAEIERLDRQLGSRGRILVRPSGTEPVIRVLVESESAEEAADVSGKVASLIRSQPRL